MSSKVNIQAPWITYVQMVKALFKDDDGIKIVYDEETYKLSLYVACSAKAIALAKLFPTTKEFGNITLTIDIVPGNDESMATTIAAAFAENPNFSYVTTGSLPGTGVVETFALFKPEVIQFYNDDLTDLFGNWNGLAQDIAKEIFVEQPGVHWNTDIKE